MDDRVLLMSGFYGVRLPDGRRMLEKPPQGQIVEGQQPGPWGLAVGTSPTFRVLNVNGHAYVLQYGPDQLPIVLEYTLPEGETIASFEGPPGSGIGIQPAGINRGHVDGWVPGSLYETGRAAEVQNPVVGQTQPAMPTPIISDPRTPYVPEPPPENTAPPFVPYQPPASGSGGSSGGGASVAPGVYEPGEYYATPQQTSLPPVTQPATMGAGALAIGAAVLFFLMGDDDDN